MTLPRGFKAQAERDAIALRGKLNLPPNSAIDITKLANIMGVTIIDGGALVGDALFRDLDRVQKGVFSAATFHKGAATYIVTNPLSSAGRRISDIAHELGHIHLGHNLAEIRDVAGVPFRTCEPSQEEEATAWGGTVLLPRPLLVAAAHNGFITAEAVGQKFDVTTEMARYRINTTGVGKLISRTTTEVKEKGVIT